VVRKSGSHNCSGSEKMMDFCQGKKRTCGEGVDEEALSLGEEISGVAGWGRHTAVYLALPWVRRACLTSPRVMAAGPGFLCEPREELGSD